MSIDEMIAVLQAARDGKVIQWRIVGCEDWLEKPKAWDFQTYQYRVKPEPFILGLNVGLKASGWTCSSGENTNLELEFIDGVLTGAKVL